MISKNIVLLITAFFSVFPAFVTQAETEKSADFECDINNGIPITKVEIEQGEKSEEQPFLTWLTKYFPDPKLAEKNCEQVADKLEELYEKGELKDIVLTSAMVEDQAVVCLQGKTDGECREDQVLFVLEDVKKPGLALREMMPENLRDKKPITVRGDFPTRINFSWLPW